ncbi:hypothetical protein ACOBQX_22090 [Actinokineospora sp. G85]|uniref:hypothetical protein n=1 Tax=Actinokineospora sp. G85 TaxID=3406626 RepID=UPI003C72E98D
MARLRPVGHHAGPRHADGAHPVRAGLSHRELTEDHPAAPGVVDEVLACLRTLVMAGCAHLDQARRG